MKTLITVLAGVAFALTLSVRAYAQPASDEYLLVRMPIYSGVPDPEFKITDSALIKELLANVASLPVNPEITSQTGDITPPQLVYRGFLIENHSARHPEIAIVKVFGSKVEIWRTPDGSAVPAKTLVKDFRLDGASAPTETLLLLRIQASRLANPRLQAAVSTRLASLKQ